MDIPPIIRDTSIAIIYTEELKQKENWTGNFSLPAQFFCPELLRSYFGHIKFPLQ